REPSKGPLLLDWKEKQSRLICLLNNQLRICRQRVEVRMGRPKKEKEEDQERVSNLGTTCPWNFTTTAIFKRIINGPWNTFSKYLASELQTVIARFKDSGFTYTGLEETFNDMEMSDKNKENREKSELAATAVQHRWPSTYMKRRFHVKNDKNWVILKAKTLHDRMIEAEAEKVSQGEEPNRFSIYQEVTGPQRPKRVLGMSHEVSSVYVFGPPSSQGSQGCSKLCREDRTKEGEK
ncbi:unnamed protein product, partial [Linum tenue]